MQTFKQTRDIIELAQWFHERLSEFYHRLSDTAERKRVKFLLDYLSRHEKHLQRSLQSYEAHASEKMLNTWFQYVPDTLTFERLQALQVQTDMSVQDVVDIVMQLDEALVDFYRELADNAESAKLREVFESLLEMEKHEEVVLLREAFQT